MNGDLPGEGGLTPTASDAPNPSMLTFGNATAANDPLDWPARWENTEDRRD
jgi:hypothetical protein